jgi:hypothetical protein
MALMQDTRVAIGFAQQADLATPNTAVELWSLRQTNRSLPYPSLVTENDSEWIGKGVWTTQVFPTNWDTAYTWEARLTSENTAQIVAFALGKVVEVAPLYTITPLDNAIDCFENLPATTIVSQLDECTEDVVDLAMVGMCCNEFTINLNSGPGLDNATMTSNWVGTGKFIRPSALTMPAFQTEHSLRAGGATITIMGTDYVANHKFVSCAMGFQNNIKLDQGFYPGSGIQNNASIRGRMRRGIPVPTLSYVTEIGRDSTEFDDFISQSEGTAVIEVRGQVIGAGPATHGFKVTYHRIMYSAQTIGENDNTVTLAVEATVLQDPLTSKVVTWEVTTEKPGIGAGLEESLGREGEAERSRQRVDRKGRRAA